MNGDQADTHRYEVRGDKVRVPGFDTHGSSFLRKRPGFSGLGLAILFVAAERLGTLSKGYGLSDSYNYNPFSEKQLIKLYYSSFDSAALIGAVVKKIIWFSLEVVVIIPYIETWLFFVSTYFILRRFLKADSVIATSYMFICGILGFLGHGDGQHWDLDNLLRRGVAAIGFTLLAMIYRANFVDGGRRQAFGACWRAHMVANAFGAAIWVAAVTSINAYCFLADHAPKT